MHPHADSSFLSPDWPPSPSDCVRTVNLQKRSRVLAARFLGGTGSSVLVVAGPDDLRE